MAIPAYDFIPDTLEIDSLTEPNASTTSIPLSRQDRLVLSVLGLVANGTFPHKAQKNLFQPRGKFRPSVENLLKPLSNLSRIFFFFFAYPSTVTEHLGDVQQRTYFLSFNSSGFTGTNPPDTADSCSRRSYGINRYDCVPGFSGQHCETNINICTSNPCSNAGKCPEVQTILFVSLIRLCPVDYILACDSCNWNVLFVYYYFMF